MMVPFDSARLWYPREQPVACNTDHSQIAKLKRGESGIYPIVKWAVQKAIPTAGDLHSETKRDHHERTVLLAQEKEQSENILRDNYESSASTVEPLMIQRADQARPQSEAGLDFETMRPYASNTDTNKHGIRISRSNPHHLAQAVTQRQSGIEDLRDEKSHSNSSRSISGKMDADMTVFDKLESAAKSLETIALIDPKIERSLPPNSSCQSSLDVQKSEPQEARLRPHSSSAALESPVKSSAPAQEIHSCMKPTMFIQDSGFLITTTRAKSTSYDGELKTAIVKGDEQKTRDLLEHGVAVNCKDQDGFTPLHDAVIYRHEHIVKILLDSGAYLGAKDDIGWTPLHWLGFTSKAPLTESLMTLLLEDGLPVDTTNSFGGTPLMAAALFGSLQLVLKLVHHGANVNASNTEGTTALHLSTKDDTIASSQTQSFPEDGLKITQFLIKQGAIVDARGRYGTPLHSAAEKCKGSMNQVKCLLEAGADKEARDDRGHTPLGHAVLHSNEACVAHLLKCGANVEVRDKQGKTPLHLSFSNLDNSAICAHLLTHGANVEARDERGWTPVMQACSFGNQACLAQLLKYRADIEIRSMNLSQTALMIAAIGNSSGCAGCVAQLLKFGADIEAKDTNNGTALHAAAFAGNIEVVKILLGHGANPFARKARRIFMLFGYEGHKPIDKLKADLPTDIKGEITALLEDAERAWKRAGKKT